MMQKPSSPQLRRRFLLYKNIPGMLGLDLLAREDAAVAYLEQETRLWRRKQLAGVKDPVYEPEDLFQEAMAVIYGRVTTPQTIAGLSLRPVAYCKQVCKYILKNKQRRKSELPVPAGVMPGAGEEGQEAKIEMQRLEKALAMLSKKCQEVLLAFFWRGRKDKDLAAEWGSSVSAIKSRRSRCRQELIERYRALPVF